MRVGWLIESVLEKKREYKLNHAYIDKEKRYCVIYRQDGAVHISRAQMKKQAKSLFAIFDKDAMEIVKIIQRREKTET